jgi:hypothetical protein
MIIVLLSIWSLAPMNELYGLNACAGGWLVIVVEGGYRPPMAPTPRMGVYPYLVEQGYFFKLFILILYCQFIFYPPHK